MSPIIPRQGETGEGTAGCGPRGPALYVFPVAVSITLLASGRRLGKGTHEAQKRRLELGDLLRKTLRQAPVFGFDDLPVDDAVAGGDCEFAAADVILELRFGGVGDGVRDEDSAGALIYAGTGFQERADCRSDLRMDSAVLDMDVERQRDAQ